MADQKPPRVRDDERTTLLALLRYQRESFLRKVDVHDDAARFAPVASGTTLLWLTNHMADAERTWLLHRFRGDDPSGAPPHSDAIRAARDRYRTTVATTDRVIASSPDLDALCPEFDAGPAVSLRWILLHLLEETARHAGHADIIREMVDGTTGR